MGAWGAWVLRFGVGFAAAFGAFGSAAGAFAGASRDLGEFSPRWIGIHLLLASGFSLGAFALYGSWPGVDPDLLVLAWIALGMAAVAAACLGFFPPRFWTGLLAAPLSVWSGALTVATLGVAAVAWSQSLWRSAARLTFEIVQFLLRPVVPALTVDLDRLRLIGKHFRVIVSQECSGLEGAGLMVVFGAVWLWLYRRDFRFPRAYLLIPGGVVVLFLLNSVRIALLFLIGEAGAARIAAGGFHSQAGWIAFNGVAFAMTVIAPRLAWFSLHPPEPRVARREANPTAAYLMPFLAILAAGMLARAVSADFEWFYVLRLLGAVAALWFYRAQLRDVDWRGGVWSVAAGVAVFGLWLALDDGAVAMPAALAASGAGVKAGWILVRTIAATLTVPIAEELAFRGFLLRRIASPDFEHVAFRDGTWLAVMVSSLLFGLLHGDRWLAATLAGLIFALVAKKTNRLGDAVWAHAVANGLLAAAVLGFGQWQYW